MSEPARKWISVEEYLAFEERAEGKHEYFHGEIFDMAGGSPEHNAIAFNLSSELGRQLEDRPCQGFSSDQRVKITRTGLYTYPDLSIVCATPQFDEQRPRSLLNPLLIVEVLSDTTEAYDRGAKFEHYRTLPSLREYVLVASNRRCVERFTREPDSDDWVLAACTDPEGAITLPSIGCRLELARVYRKVELPAPTLRLRTEPE
jgi:Uma2 family endonuclease